MNRPAPATTLKDAFNLCDPSLALDAGDPRWVDLAPGRGDEGSAMLHCQRRILWSAIPLVQLLAGHRGCGKSTELRRLQRNLEREGYCVVYFEAEGDLDLEDTEPTDVLLAFLRNLEAGVRQAGFPLDPKLLADFEQWFFEVVLERQEKSSIEGELRGEVSVEGGVPLLAKLLARLTGQVKTGTESKKLLRRRLDPQVSQLLARGQLLVMAARQEVRRKGLKDLVVIADNLDRIALKDRGDGRTSHEVLFLERGELLKGLGCHAVLTVPISLCYSPKLASLNAIFPDRHVLPMVKITQRGTRRRPWAPGIELLRDLLRHRLDLEALFAPGVVDSLIQASGGHPRLLMTLVRYGLNFVDQPPVPAEAARKAIRNLMNDYGRSIPDAHWPLLARVYRDQAVHNDADHQLMLFNLSVLEYQNEERWCDVLPVIRELPAFAAARRRLRAEKTENSGKSEQKETPSA